jgi:uncharacterized repeat protein (TIGR01451 family)
MRSPGFRVSLRLTPVFLLAALGAAASSPAAMAATPAWQIMQSALPTRFVPGSQLVPEYSFYVRNVGGAPAEEFTMTDTLPTGLTPASNREPRWFIEGGVPGGSGECEVAGQVIKCIVPSLKEGKAVEMRVPVAVSPSSPASVSNELVIEGGGASTASSRLATAVTSEPSPFEFFSPNGLSGSVSDDAGNAPAAGSHPFVSIFNIQASSMEGAGTTFPTEGLRSAKSTLPHGLVVNPQATSVRCAVQELTAEVREPSQFCPAASEVGEAIIQIPGIGWATSGLYNMVSPPGHPAELAFIFENTIIMIRGGLSEGFDLTAESSDLLTKFQTSQISIVLWGNPSDGRHDHSRRGQDCLEGCSIEPEPAPLVTMPTSCGEAESLTGTITSWRGSEYTRTVSLTDRNFEAFEVVGCNALEFNPTISSKATTNVADSPSGLDFNLHQPQNQQLDGLATAALKDSTVTLPAGMNLNPAVADGLSACSEAQMGYAPEEGKIHFATTPQTCPDASKLGTVEISTPLLAHKLPGAVYLAKPYENPFANLTAIYLAIEDEESGIVAKLAGKATPDPVTGQLTASFTENPELPVEDIDLHFFNGARGAFTTPLTCGTKTTTSVLTPWSTPEGADAAPSDSFQTQVPAGGSGNCPNSEANAPNKPAFTAGTVSPEAGAYSPFVLKLTRPDGTQRLTAIDTTLPKGLAAKFAGIPYCSDAQIAQAQSRSNPNQGALEQASPSCPAASEVGTVEVGAGSGPTPTYVSGHAYLSGPYKGAPLSLAIVTPAVAGPFDLGTVVVRTAIYIDPETAQGRAVSDPLPSILQGIPLDIRSVAIKLDRPGGFTLNPTSCDPMAVSGSAMALSGQSAALTSPFQVGGCSALKFKPKLAISLKGGTKRHRFPALKAVLTYPKGANANIASTQVTLPHGEFLEQGHIGTVCTRVQFAANACPKASIYGKAKAITPLLDQPLEGPVYLRSSSHELPDLVAALNGQIDVVLAGRVDTGKGGGIRNTFEAVPDAPVSKFVLEMKGGKKGLLVNSEDICRRPQRASVSFTGQNGKAFDATPLIANSCGGKAKKRGSKKGRGGKKKG